VDPRVVLGQSYAAAIAYASALHARQGRKGTDVPYVAHLLGTSALVLESGGDEDLAIAALLHDAAEDHGGEERLADIEAQFGQRVECVVRECSDSLVAEGGAKAPWEQRKREHLARLSHASDDTILVWLADKVHNSRAIVTDLLVEGPSSMRRFAAEPPRILWYYEANLHLGRERQGPRVLVETLDDTVRRMRELLSGT
jgi:(p)ppGpp synthase/HD superfamily hydrolase